MDIANYLYSTRGSVGGDAAGIYDARVLESPQTACVKRGLDSRYAACRPPSVDAAANYGRAAARQELQPGMVLMAVKDRNKKL